MCGIIGCYTEKNCVEKIYQTLSLLEYRGYDSVGMAVINQQNELAISKKIGGTAGLPYAHLQGHIGIGHTRWATHGAVCNENAHPHFSENFALVHNGIIENYQEIKKNYLSSNTKFTSTTDSEVLVHLIEKFYQQDRQGCKINDTTFFLKIVQKALQYVQGTYSLAIISKAFPNQMICVRNRCPLIVGISKTNAAEIYICSDIQAISPQVHSFCFVDEMEFVHIDHGKCTFYDIDGKIIHKQFKEIYELPMEIKKEKNSYMEEEIYAIPQALHSCHLALKESGLDTKKQQLKKAKAVHVIGCGTSYHAGLVFQSLLQKYTEVTTFCHLASEMQDKANCIQKDDIIIVLSQSGETADTLEAVRFIEGKQAFILALTNVQYSSLQKLSAHTIWLRAGIEVAVAATKSYNCQLFALYYIFAEICKAKGLALPAFLEKLHSLPALAEQFYQTFPEINQLVKVFQNQQGMAILGRGLDLPTAKEVALKIKEITYIYAEGYAAGELKHGSLALVDKNFCVLAIATQKQAFSKIENALAEVKSRQGKTILCSPYTSNLADYHIPLPKVEEEFMPILSIIPLQYFACKLSEARGINPDKPKNLAKSVTVE